MGPKVQSKGEVSGFEKRKQIRHVQLQARVRESLEMKQERRQDLGGGGLSLWTDWSPSHFLLWTQSSALKESFPNSLHAPLGFFTE